MKFIGYCPFCDEGFSAQKEDISYMMGNPYIICPACGQNIILPSLDTNNSGDFEKDELHPCLNNPNYLKIEEE